MTTEISYISENPLTIKPLLPQPGGVVLVTFFDGNHELHSTAASVLAIGDPEGPMSTDDGIPALTIAYPKVPADTRVLGSPRWADGFARAASVPHFSHPDAIDGKVSIVWGHALDARDLPNMINAPTNSALNPTYQRQDDQTTTEVSVEQAVAVQTGKAPTPTTQSPLINEPADAPVIETVTYTDGTKATGVAPLPPQSPEQQEAAEEPHSGLGEPNTFNTGTSTTQPETAETEPATS